MTLRAETAVAAVTAIVVVAICFAIANRGVPRPQEAERQVGSNAVDEARAPSSVQLPDLSRRELPPADAMRLLNVPDPMTGCIEVTYYYSTGEPVPHRLPVYLSRSTSELLIERSESTDNNGTAMICNLEPGLWIVWGLAGRPSTCTVAADSIAQRQLFINNCGPLQGRVVDQGGSGVAGASVFLSGFSDGFPQVASCTTGHDGRFAIPERGEARFAYAKAAGHEPSEIAVFSEGLPATLEMCVTHNGATLTVAVLDEQGATQRDAPVWLSKAVAKRGVYPQLGRWQDDGTCFFDAVPVGTVRIEAWSPDVGPALGSAHISEGAHAFATVRFTAGASVVGVVQDADGNPVASAGIFVVEPALVTKRIAVSDDHGAYRLGPTRSGAVAIVARHRQWGTDSTTLQLSPNGTTRWDPVLGRPQPIRGVVVDASGHPVSGTKVLAGCGDNFKSAVTDAWGSFEFAGMSHCEYVLEVREADNSGTLAQVRGVLPGRTDVRLVIDDAVAVRSSEIVGKCVSISGQAVQGATLIFSSGEPKALYTSVVTAADGSFVSPPLRAGSCKVSVNHPMFAPANWPVVDLRVAESRNVGTLELTPAADLVVELTATRKVQGQLWLADVSGKLCGGSQIDMGPGTESVSLERVPLVALSITLVSGDQTVLARTEAHPWNGEWGRVPLRVEP